MLLVGLVAALMFSPIHVSAAVLKEGSHNNEVKKVQTVLKQLGYFSYPKITGYYGSITIKAVKKFQREKGLVADGIVGSKTQKAFVEALAPTQLGTDTQDTKTIDTKTVETKTEETSPKTQTLYGALDWYKKVQYIWVKGTNATITDVDTGKSFEVKRTYGHNNADVEPLTKKDSKIIKDIWNGWSWERRAVIVNINGSILAGSMTAMPHAGVDSSPANKIVSWRSGNYGRGYNLDAVKNNGVSGVMDIHFLNSRTHSSNRVLKSQQDMVKKANSFIKKLI
jgi:hypothetical protein